MWRWTKAASIGWSPSQPNLLLGAVRHLDGDFARDWPQFRERFFDRRSAALELIRTHRTQTNEPARCAVLLPVPAALPHVVWRAGLDGAPIDVTDDESVAWLESLVWPGQGDRLALLRAAVQVARTDPPRIVRGDLRHDLPALAQQAPADATLVVFHTAVLGYVHDAEDRRRFAATVRSVGARWIANEPPGVVEVDQPPRPAATPGGEILLSLDGEPLAWADPHGAWIQWLV